MYLGQAEIEQDSLEGFMDVAQELEISGLSESIQDSKEGCNENDIRWETNDFEKEVKKRDGY